MACSGGTGLVVTRCRPLDCTPATTQGIQLMSDLHRGSSLSVESVIRRELDYAADNNDRIVLGGDLLDAITPKDKRFTPSCVSKNLQGRDDLLDAQVDDAEELLSPYAHLIDGIGSGNHETKPEMQGGVDLIRQLIRRLHAKGYTHIQPLGYTALITYPLEYRGRVKGWYTIHYHHGSGKCKSAAAALVALARRKDSFQADLYWSGHWHQRANSHDMIMAPNQKGRPVARDVRFVVTGSYCNPYQPQSSQELLKTGRKGNYASDSGFALRGMGGARVTLEWDEPGFPARVKVEQ